MDETEYRQLTMDLIQYFRSLSRKEFERIAIVPVEIRSPDQYCQYSTDTAPGRVQCRAWFIQEYESNSSSS